MHQAKIRAPAFLNANNIINKSFDGTRTGNISTSQDFKSTIEHNDITELLNKSFGQKKTMESVQKPGQKTNYIKLPNRIPKGTQAWRPETLPNMDNSIIYESDTVDFIY